jgi:hypothetical protein
MPPPPLPTHPRRANSKVETLSDGRWRQTRLSDEIRPLQQQTRLPVANDAYMMNGALPSRQKHYTSVNDYVCPEQRYEPRQPAAQHAEQYYVPAQPVKHHRDEQRPSPVKPFVNDPSPNTQVTYINEQQPTYECSRSSVMGQPLMPVHLHSNVRQRNSGYHSIAGDYVAEHRLPTREPVMPRTGESITHNMAKAMESPFFQANQQQPRHPYLRTPMATHSSPVPQPEQLSSGVGRLHMAPLNDTPPMSQSLNSLSFIQEPYTEANKPVYTRSASRTLPSRLVPPQRNSFAAQPNQHRSYLQDPHCPPSRTSVAPSIGQSIRHILSRRNDVQLNAFKGVRSSLQVPTYGTNTNQSRFPYQQHQQRGVYTANGRRSVRR